MAATLTAPGRLSDSERERLRRRRDRHARLATDRAVTELAFKLRARDREDRGLDPTPRLRQALERQRPDRARGSRPGRE